MKNKTHMWIGGALIVVALLIGLSSYLSGLPGKYDDFALCLQEKGATFYGAFWCPHCQEQKALFGRSAKRLPYVECSTPDGKAQLPVCIEKNIESYPTWIFADGSVEKGLATLDALAGKTGCILPK